MASTRTSRAQGRRMSMLSASETAEVGKSRSNSPVSLDVNQSYEVDSRGRPVSPGGTRLNSRRKSSTVTFGKAVTQLARLFSFKQRNKSK